MKGNRELNLEINEKHYIPGMVEAKIYALWERAGVLNAGTDFKKTAFSMVIPPPNITGRLHMGHGLNNIIRRDYSQSTSAA